MTATIKDVAALAKVSFSAVSAVLAGRHVRVRPETRQRILQAAQELHYEPSNVGRSLRSGRSHLVACLAHRYDLELLLDALAGAEETLQQNGYCLMLLNYRDTADFDRRLTEIRRQRVDGVIFTMLRDSDLRQRAALFAREVPVVSLFTSCPELPSSVYVDGVTLVRQGFKYLLGLGHRCIALTGERPHALETARAIFQENGLPLGNLHYWPELKHFDAGDDILRRYRESTPRPTAVFCYSDETAAGLLRAAASAGILIPQELSVMGVNNDRIASMLSPGLTTMAQPHHGQGEAAAEMLLQLMDGHAVPPETVLQPELLLRGSCSIPPT